MPYHAKLTLLDYGLGLGVNCMEGSEQKHQVIAKYSNNTTVQNRCPLIFRHEFIQLVHLRESGYDETIYQKRKKSYIPQPNQQSCSKCFFEIQEDGNCFFCDGDIVKIILCQITKR